MNKIDNDLFLILEKTLLNRYEHALEIHRMTEELKEALDRNDTASSEVILGMRENEMECYDVCNRNLEHICDDIGEEDLYNLVFDRPCFQLDGENVERLKKIVIRTKYTLSKAVKVDQIISKRLAGESSFYNVKEE